jgi:hypothetical protein
MQMPAGSAIPFEPSRYVHAVTKDVSAFNEHITQVDANAE